MAFAFRAQPDLLRSSPVTNQDVSPLSAQFAGPNRVVIEAESDDTGEQLVVLVSDYPGWQLFVDGQRTMLQPLNGYLGAWMRPGEHTYTFVFRPLKYYIGLAISSLTLAVVLGILLVESPLLKKKRV